MRIGWRGFDRLVLALTWALSRLPRRESCAGRGTAPFGRTAATLAFYGAGALVALGAYRTAGRSAILPRVAGKGILYVVAAVSSLPALVAVDHSENQVFEIERELRKSSPS